MAFRNILEYRNGDGRVNSDDDLATSRKNLVNFGPVSPELTRVVCVYTALISSGVSL